MNNLEKLINDLKKATKEALNTEVAEMVKDEIKVSAMINMYSAYEPTMYDRRMENGGLIDDANIRVTKSIDSELGIEVEDIAKANEENFLLAPLIEFGDGYNGLEYDYKTNKGGRSYGSVDAIKYLRPRPFIEEANEEIKRNKKHIKALKSGLNRKGINVSG